MNKDDLEMMVDQYGLYGVLEMLEKIAYEKADHIETNWQDRNLAKRWEKAAQLLLTANAKIVDLLP